MSDVAVLESPPPSPRVEAERTAPCRVVLLSAGDRPRWEDYVLEHPQSTIFHSLAWKDAVGAAFPHKDLYLFAERGRRVVGVLPLFLIDSRLAGRMLVSVPYGVCGGIVAGDSETVTALFTRARELADEYACPTIDLRSELPQIPELPVVDRYVGFERDLPERESDVLAWLPRKARAAARNGRDKYGLTASFGDEHLPAVWRLYSRSMRRLASLTYPYRFLAELAGHTPDRHWTCLVRWNGEPVAGLFTLLFRDRVMPYFVGTMNAARRCSAANFIYMVTMQRAVAEGFRVFDFGRSRRENSGSYDFKRFHGFEPRPLGYQRLESDPTHRIDLSPENAKFAFARRLWPYLPLRVSQALGATLARHIPG